MEELKKTVEKTENLPQSEKEKDLFSLFQKLSDPGSPPPVPTSYSF